MAVNPRAETVAGPTCSRAPLAQLSAASPTTRSRAISTALLLPQDRVTRAPLTAWAERLAEGLNGYRTTTRRARDYSGGVAGIANNAALIATYQGFPELARSLCEQQMRWQSRLGRRLDDEVIAARALQSWVNLGRLDALSGDWSAAVDRFSGLRTYRSGRPLFLNGLCIPGVDAGADAHTAAFDRLPLSLYVIESLKALLSNGRHREVLVFVAEIRPDTAPALLRFAEEAATIASCRIGDFDTARSTAATASGVTWGWQRAVFRLRLAEVLSCEGDGDGATAILVNLAGVLGQLSPAKRGELTSLYVLLRVCTACAEAGLTAEAVATARNIYEGARAAGDQVFEIESLRILSDMDPGPERERWGESLAELEETTDYVRYRRGDRRPIRKLAIDRLYDLVTETLSG